MLSMHLEDIMFLLSGPYNRPPPPPPPHATPPISLFFFEKISDL